MIFNKHSELEGKHAFLGASKYYWLNYTEDQLIDRYRGSWSPTIGTVLHELASKLIRRRMKLSKNDRHLVLFYLTDNGVPEGLINMNFIFSNFQQYVNDAIGYRMTPEQVLVYSDTCFGTTDAISFRDGVLRIHDLKTGTMPAHMEQLEIYAALFCLEYNVKPKDIQIELRIYQADEVSIFSPTEDDIMPIINKITEFSKILDYERGVEV